VLKERKIDTLALLDEIKKGRQAEMRGTKSTKGERKEKSPS